MKYVLAIIMVLASATAASAIDCVDFANKLPIGCKPVAHGPIPATAGQSTSIKFANVTDDLLKKINADVVYALALAKATNNSVTVPCWQAWVDLTTQQLTPLKDAQGNVIAIPEPHVFVEAERVSEFVNQIQLNSPLNVGCGAALNASRMSVTQLISAVLAGSGLGLFPGL